MTELKTVVVVGVGALGSHLVQFLRSVPSLYIKVVDFDKVEARNTEAQFHAKASVRKNKAQALAQSMNFLFGCKLEAVPHKLTADNVEVLLGGADLVVDCLDNAASRRTVQGFVRAQSIACLHGGLAADGTFGVVMWDKNFTIDDEPEDGAATCEGGEHLPFIATVSSRLAYAAQQYLESGMQLSYQISGAGARRV